jgi:hypothetical protein
MALITCSKEVRFLPEICLLIHTWNNQGTTVLSTRHTHTPTCSLVALQVCNSHSAHHLVTKNRSSGPAFCGTVKVANVISMSQRYTWHHCTEYGKLGLMVVTVIYSSDDFGVAGVCLNLNGTSFSTCSMVDAQSLVLDVFVS